MVGSSSKRGAAVVDLTGEDNFAPTNMSESSRKREHAFIDLTGADQYVGANRNKMPRIAHIAAGSSQYLPLQISSDVESEDGDQWEESVEWPDGSQEYDEVALQMLEHYGKSAPELAFLVSTIYLTQETLTRNTQALSRLRLSASDITVVLQQWAKWYSSVESRPIPTIEMRFVC